MHVPNFGKQVRWFQIGVHATTWYRDSHGLFDYEEYDKITTSQLTSNRSFFLSRDHEYIKKEDIIDFKSFRRRFTKHDGTHADINDVSAVCYQKENNFWVYHRHTIENGEEEKMNPGDKLWLVLRHMENDEDYEFQPGYGFKLELGDIVKFGRVRYKVLMMHSSNKGL